MNPRCQRGQSRSLSRGRGGRAVGDNWRPSILPPISWGGGFDREDLSEDSWHSLNRTWQGDGESFHTLSSGDSYRSLLSLFSDSEDSVSDPGDQLLELLEEAEVIRDSLGTLETSPGFPEVEHRSLQAPEGWGLQGGLPEVKVRSSQVPGDRVLWGGLLEIGDCTSRVPEDRVLQGGLPEIEDCTSWV